VSSPALAPATIVSLVGAGRSAAEVGGKAAALDRLVGLGLPVPASAVVPTWVYRSAVAGPPLAPLLDRLRADDLDLDAGAVDAAFLELRLPEPVVEHLLVEARALRRASSVGELVVRSSATAEDTGEASFAGQYRSILGVTSDQEVLRAVKLVWASLWHPGARHYRRLLGMQDADIAMAVLLMAQVDARLSGVLFTEDPEGGPGAARVEMVEGLADQLVSGRVTPTVHLVRLGEPSSSPAVVREVAELGRRIEAAFGLPQDIEWAYDAHQVFIVQARPITTARRTEPDPFESALEPTTTYTSTGVAEMLPGALAPLIWTVAGPLQEEGFRELFASVGAPMDAVDGRALLRRVRARAVLDFDLLSTLAASLPRGSAEELRQQYFGDQHGDVPSPAGPRRHGPGRTGAHDIRLVRCRHRAVQTAAVVAAAVDHVLAADVEPAELSDRELLAYRARLLDLAGRGFAAEALVAAAAAAGFRRLEVLLASWLGAEHAPGLAQRLTAGSTGLAGTLNGVDPGRAGARRSAGSRAVFAGPSWEEAGTDPSSLETMVVRAPEWQAELSRVESDLQHRSGWRRTRLLTGQVVDVRIHLLRRAVTDARVGLARRETAKAAMLRLGGEVRRLHLEAGRRLRQRGALLDPSDVDLLSSAELVGGLGGEALTPLLELQRRRHQLASASSTEVPQVFVGEPTRDESGRSLQGDVYQGWPSGPGRAEGVGRVICDPLLDRLPSGDVLVARATDASWLPLFSRAAAIVVERGGPLSHAAICARELGLPAVLNVAGLCERLTAEPARLVVDGDAGTVTVLPPEPAVEMVETGRGSLPVEATAGPAPEPASAEVLEDLDAAGTNVFVPAIMSIGVLFSVASLLVDVARALFPAAGSRRRTALRARYTADAVLGAIPHEPLSRAGLRSRATYAALAAAFVAFATYLVIGQTGNFLREHGYLNGIAWLWALSLLVSGTFIVLAWWCATTVATYPRQPERARAVFMTTPLAKRPAEARGHGHRR
jgi:pyruvate,water dikinase